MDHCILEKIKDLVKIFAQAIERNRCMILINFILHKAAVKINFSGYVLGRPLIIARQQDLVGKTCRQQFTLILCTCKPFNIQLHGFVLHILHPIKGDAIFQPNFLRENQFQAFGLFVCGCGSSVHLLYQLFAFALIIRVERLVRTKVRFANSCISAAETASYFFSSSFSSFAIPIISNMAIFITLFIRLCSENTLLVLNLFFTFTSSWSSIR